MKLYIKSIILYPKDRTLKPQVITFKEDKVNIITGNSQKGKSAIISIIDYCLGSSECHIPIGPIRDTVEVYALYLKIKGGYLFIGRENYEDSKTAMYLYKEAKKGENISLRTTEWLDYKEEYKENLQHIKEILNNLAGFKSIKIDEESNSPFNSSASFRDTTSLLFQTQNIIANPSTMFYKTDSWEHLQKLKTILPLILGYKSYDILSLNEEIHSLERERKVLTDKQDGIINQYESWKSDIYEYYSEAIRLGLTNSDIDISTSTVSLLKNELSDIVSNSKKGILYKEGSANRYSEKINDLQNTRTNIIRELNILKNNLQKIDELEDSRKLYINNVAFEKENRLKPIEWFLEQNGTNKCPFCNSESTKAIDQLLSLKDEREKNEKELKGSFKLNFDKERNFTKKEIDKKEFQIRQIDKNLDIILREVKEEGNSYQKKYEFIGKIEYAISNLNKIAPSGELSLKIDELKKSINEKRKKLKELESHFDKAHSLNKLTKTIDKYVKILPIEKSNHRKVHLDPDSSLNIKVEDTNTKDRYFLSRIGSGANYMGYHIATILGLHEFLYKLKDIGKPNFIPSFVIFDQPSQVFYPDKFDSEKEEESSKDVQDTKKIFIALKEFMKNTDYQIQVILLEHVPELIWKGIDDNIFNISGIWRDETNKALIPKNWI